MNFFESFFNCGKGQVKIILLKDLTFPSAKDKRLDFNIWYDQKNAMILKVSYSRMGNWEYRLKNFE